MDFDDKIMGIGITLRNLIIGIAILILTMFVVVYGVNIFYPGVDYDDYCTDIAYPKLIESQKECEAQGGKWNAYEEEIRCVTEPCPQGYCEIDFRCRQDYDDAREARQQKVFIIAVPLGLILIALGAFVFKLNSVGLGIMFGGIGTLLYGAGGYWEYSENLFKFIISLFALIILIWLGYYFDKKRHRRR